MTAQNFIISLQMRFKAKNLITRKEYERAIRLLRESFKYNNVLEIDKKIYADSNHILNPFTSLFKDTNYYFITLRSGANERII